jgi:hypothetical protein
MSLLWLDGFESYGTALGASPVPSGIVGTKYLVTSPNGQSVENGPVSGRSLRLRYGNFKTPFINLDDTDDTLIMGCHIYITEILSDSYLLLGIFSGTDWGGLLYLDGGELRFRDADGDYTSGTEQGLKGRVWYYIEMKVTNHATTGSFEVRLNGVNVLSGSGLNTKGGSITYYNVVKVYGDVIYPVYDNLYVCNSAGSINNDFLGSIQVMELRPGADSTSNFATATPSASHYENANDEVSDEDTSYNQDNTTGALEMYVYNNLTGVASVLGVVIDARLKTTAGDDEDFQHSVDSGSTVENSSSVTTNVETFQTYTYVFEKDPDTSAAWTVSGVNAATFGIELQ